jgi:glycosyltransferase involved in cell wall biosynthesis
MTGGRRILITFGGYGEGLSGAETMALRAATHLARRGHDVVVLTDADRPAGTGAERIRQVRADAASAPQALARAVPGWQPDLVHAFDLAKPLLVAAGREVAQQAGRPFVLTPCSAPSTWPDPEAGRAACRAAGAAFTLTGAEGARLAAAGVPADRIRVVPPAADEPDEPLAQRFRQRTGIAGPVVLFVGRRVPAKGYRELLLATRVVWRTRPDVRFVFLGPDGGDAGRHFAEHADDRVHDLGVTNDRTKHDAIAASSVLCLPTSADVFPLVFIEAWAQRRPVISGDFAGVTEVVRHGIDGLIVRPRPEPIAAALLDLLGDPDRRLAMGRAGQDRVRRSFGWDRVAECYEKHYLDVLGRPEETTR